MRLLMLPIFSLLLLATFSQNAIAARPKALTVQKIEQLLTVAPVVYQQGSLKGQAVDQNAQRSVLAVPELETAESYFVSNFYNQGKFWIAEIPKSSVKKVIFQLALFKGPLDFLLAHAQYRFLLDTPARLYRVRSGRIVTTQTGDMIFTIQAAMPAGVSYNPADAFLGAYKIVGRLINSYDRAQIEETVTGDIVTQYVLKNMNPAQMSQLLLNAVSFSTENKMNKPYMLMDENCISIAFDLVDRAMNIQADRVTLNFKNLLLNGKSPNEKMALDALLERGLIDEKSRIENYK